MPIHVQFFRQAILTRKVRQTDLVLAHGQGSVLGPCTQDYKSQCAAVVIRSIMVNIQTHTDRQTAS